MSEVIVILDPRFGQQLVAISAGIPVWIIDTHINREVVQRLWNERASSNHLTGITLFQSNPADAPETNLIEVFSTIDLHNGPASTDDPYMELRVIGAMASQAVRNQLAESGFTEFKEVSDGFTAKRHVVPPLR